MSIPETQKVIIVRETGDLDALKYEQDFPVPKFSDDEILIKNKFSGVNFIEVYFRKGIYPSALPLILGREATGVVAAVGKNVTAYSVGDKVAYLSGSTFAQYTSFDPTGKIIKLPTDVSEEELKILAGALLQGLTALTFVEEAYTVKKGDFILIWAAAGGVGRLLVQLVALRGARAIAVASSPEKLQIAKDLGAEFLINSSTDDVVAKVKEFTDGKGVHASFDGVGRDSFFPSLNSLARKGTLVTFGNSSGPIDPVPLTAIGPLNLKLVRPNFLAYLGNKEEWEQYIGQLLELIRSGKLDIAITETYPLSDYKSATAALEARKTTGKLVLEIPQ